MGGYRQPDRAGSAALSEPCSAVARSDQQAAERRPALRAVAGVLPPHAYSQDQLLGVIERLWGAEGRPFDRRRLRRFYGAVRVGKRHLALPAEEYARLHRFEQANDAFIEIGTELGAEAVSAALRRARLNAADLDAIFFATVTGVSTPTIDARLINRLRLRQDVRRTPIFGLGCLAGAAGMSRMSDYLRAYPSHTAALLSVELCSLTLQRGDLSPENLIASALFGDGAAAVIAVGGAHAMRRAGEARGGRRRSLCDPRVVDNRSVFYRDTEHIMGWQVSGSGFKVVLSAGLPALIEEHLAADVDGFLADNGLRRTDIARWICHPGGPKVLGAIQNALGLSSESLAPTWRSLHRIGNLSSASVLFVLRDVLAADPPRGDRHALLMAMGPGFCAELVLLRW